MKNPKRLMEEIRHQIRDEIDIIGAFNQLEKNGLSSIEIVVLAYPIGISYKGVYHYRSDSTNQV